MRNKPDVTFKLAFNLLKQIEEPINQIIVGKQEKIRLALVCILAQGHLLIEGSPGEGKTTFAQALGVVLGLESNRIQFTNDLLPADILGGSVYSREQESFKFHKGPVFTQLLLADEINRASPKTQSALLEAMAEKRVTVEGATYELPTPFFVMATQNPSDQFGTHALPESQLDRFLMCIKLGYPDRASERQVLIDQDRQSLISTIKSTITTVELAKLQTITQKQHCSDSLLDYVQNIAEFTRQSDLFTHGLSTRCLIGMLASAKAYSLFQEREYVLPEDVQAILPATVNHRLVLNLSGTDTAGDIILSNVAVG